MDGWRVDLNSNVVVATPTVAAEPEVEIEELAVTGPEVSLLVEAEAAVPEEQFE